MAKYADGNGLSHAFTVIKNWVTTNFSDIAHTHAASDITNAVTGVKGNSETDYRTGNVNLTASNVGAAASSHSHGDITNGGDITASAPTVASGDKLIINDESASKITNGPSFGNSTTTYLRNDGTWGTPAGTSYSDFTGATSSAAGTHGLVPAPSTGEQSDILTGDGGWTTIAGVINSVTGSASGILEMYQDSIRVDATNTLMTPAQSTKLDGIATGAEVNQNAFSNVKVGSTTVAADSKTDTVELVGSNVTLTPDATNDKVTIGITATDVTTALGTTAVARASANASGTAFGAAATKAVDSSISSTTSTNLPTSEAVASYVSTQLADVAGALVYQGTAATAAAVSGSSYKKGWYWIASASFTLWTNGPTVEAGDMIIAKQDKTATFSNDIDVVQTNIEALTTAEIDALWAAA